MNQKPAGSTLGHPKALLAGTVWALYDFIGLFSHVFNPPDLGKLFSSFPKSGLIKCEIKNLI